MMSTPLANENEALLIVVKYDESGSLLDGLADSMGNAFDDPPFGALITYSIFMAMMETRGSPGWTTSPGFTLTLSTTPGMGAVTPFAAPARPREDVTKEGLTRLTW